MADPLDSYFEVFEAGEPPRRYIKFPCQCAGSEPGEMCHVPIDVVKKQFAWESANAARLGPVVNPTISPSVRCTSNGCHFFLKGGKFNYCEDHKGRRVDG